MRVRVIAAVLFLLAVEAGLLAYFAGDFRPVRLDPPESSAATRRASAPDLARVDVRTGTPEPDLPIDLSHVGRPFRVSDSVVKDCRHLMERGCQALDEFLGLMAAQSRDPDWAARTEARLARVLTRGGRRDYQIRALECRSSLCAIEVASELEYPRISLSPDDALDRELAWSGPTVSAWEEDADMLTIVTVVSWIRRPRSELEDPSLPVTDHQQREQHREPAQPEQQ